MATVLIIGASRGIGLETVRAALKGGHSVRALARSARRIPVEHPKLEKMAGDALEMATVKPAQVINRVDKLGTLQVGAPADVSILELVHEPVEFVDTRDNHRHGDRWLKPMQTVRAGVPFGRPYPSPFAWP